jgi:hypothetical protein
MLHVMQTVLEVHAKHGLIHFTQIVGEVVVSG